MLNIKDITKSGNYIAIGNDKKNYPAIYNAELKTMFFCIPSHVKVLGYIEK